MDFKQVKERYQAKSDNIYHWIYKHSYIFLIALGIILGLLARFLLFKYPTRDLTAYVFPWLEKTKEVGFPNLYTIDSDYSPIYLTMLYLVGLLPQGEIVTRIGNGYAYPLYSMYYIKGLFALIDLSMAIGVFLIVHHMTNDKMKAAIGLMCTFALPMEILNSAMWGQCDGIYTTFFVYAVYFMLKRKGSMTMLMAGFALSIKMQGIFIIPLLVYMIMRRRIKLYQFLFLILGLFSTFLPFWLVGAPLLSPFNYISKQMNGYSDLYLGAGSIFKFFHFNGNSQETKELFSTWSLVFGLMLMGVFLAIIYVRRIKLTDQNVIGLAAFLIGMVPFLLPHMHERYFYCLDVFSLIYVLTHKKRYYIVPMMQLASLIEYSNYLLGKYFFDILREDSVIFSALLNLAVLTILFIDITKMERIDKDDESDGHIERCEKKNLTLTYHL